MKKGFTLVELAIVITIIGLLIGGVLKGQELLQNARMTSAAAQIKASATATITFKDIYKALPGDIVTPANFLQNCTTSPCNVSGNGDGIINAVNSWVGNERNNFWLHLAKAGLISGVDPSATWDATGSTFLAAQPRFPLGGALNVTFYSQNTAPYNIQPLQGAYFVPLQSTPDGSSYAAPTPVNDIGKYDLKADDGKPWTGEIVLGRNSCGVGNADNYKPDERTACIMIISAGF